ncbi:MAG: hypothetical protein ACTHZ5_10375 [Micrococcaceae bacterium]
MTLIALGGLYFTSPGEHSAWAGSEGESTVECAPLSTASNDSFDHEGKAEQASWTATEQQLRDLCTADRQNRQTQIIMVTGLFLAALILLSRRRDSVDES